MRVEKQELKNLFDGDRTYLMPLFQRPYVWEEANWETIWNDVVRTVDDIAAYPDVQHFIGAIVLEQLPRAAGRIPQYQVIDGQQRLATIQVLLKAALDVLSTRDDAASSMEVISGYLFNKSARVKEESDKYKIWPTNQDRPEYVTIMDGADVGTEAPGRITGAYNFFYDRIGEWLNSAEDLYGSTEAAVDQLIYVIDYRLAFAELDLEKHDDPQEIFETLNALGTPLRASDLIKNHLFRLAQAVEMDLDGLYKSYWKELEEKPATQFWESTRSVGRFNRAEIDIFFQYWMSIQAQRDVAADTVFREFRKHMADADRERIEATFMSIRGYSRVYRQLQNMEGDERERLFVARLKEMETYAVYPLVLFFYDNNDSTSERHEVLDILESFLVRRLVLRLNARSYSRAGTDTMHALWGEHEISAAALRDRLRQYQAAGTRWPTDDELISGLRQNAVYGMIRQSRLAMVLLAVNERMHSERSEVVSVQANLQIEHIMPQNWKDHWPLPPGNEAERRQERDALINTIGNLTVITGKLNQSVSNGPWTVKRDGLNQYSNLVINRELVQEEDWNEKKIVARSEQIARYICEIWPR